MAGKRAAGHFAYCAVPGNLRAVPGNLRAVSTFRTQVTRHWLKVLRRRSQHHHVNWERMDRLSAQWRPPARILHPYPEARFAART